MLHRYFIVFVGLLALWLAPISASAAIVDFTDDLTGFSNSISTSLEGGNQGQGITASVGTVQGAANAINGDSIFVTIDTTSVNPVGSGSYGGGIQTIIDGAFDAGDLNSTNASDYEVIFDVAANGFAPNNVDIFLQFRNEFNDNQLGGAQLSINQNNAVFAPFVTQLGATDGTVQVRIGLDEFSNLPADISGLATSDRIQFTFNTRSLDANYSADAGNVLVLDNIGVSLNTAVAVPEPSSLALFAVGGVVIASRRRRRTNS